MKWNVLKKVFCPKKGENTFANGTKDNSLRCGSCGEKHGSLGAGELRKEV